MKKIYLTSVVLAVTALYATYATTINVSIVSFKFTPSMVHAQVGDTVIWTLSPTETHTVVSTSLPPGAAPINGTFSDGQIYKYKVTEPGTYNYKCGIHASMTGSIMVSDVTSTLNGLASEGLSLFPNPTAGDVNISLNPAHSYDILVSDEKGNKMVVTQVVQKNDFIIHAEKFAAGIYFVQLSLSGDNSDKRKVFKFVKD